LKRPLGALKKPLEDANIFVLVDEGHRSQYGGNEHSMQKTLPNACFIAMTGTPLMKKERVQRSNLEELFSLFIQ
jgi:type I site-specific restriction-modification system R (restriction) subunit